jgi:hypothetical protein
MVLTIVLISPVTLTISSHLITSHHIFSCPISSQLTVSRQIASKHTSPNHTSIPLPLGIFSFTIKAEDAAISGPPEGMDWLQSLSFRGVMCEGRLIGKYSLSAYVQTLPALKPGDTRVDRFGIADKVRRITFICCMN